MELCHIEIEVQCMVEHMKLEQHLSIVLKTRIWCFPQVPLPWSSWTPYFSLHLLSFASLSSQPHFVISTKSFTYLTSHLILKSWSKALRITLNGLKMDLKDTLIMFPENLSIISSLTLISSSHFTISYLLIAHSIISLDILGIL